ncbi:hypothetical protein CEXT_505171 [Caerostris extrusa]|uniref:Uncharacterized protein n=1 Tax=Caerostris extrusa TaxID=172846 RepID=A0AAV4WF85_CAEEX|nr:hypothetical protein CEXT_505171 [Caerostris extrusa]
MNLCLWPPRNHKQRKELVLFKEGTKCEGVGVGGAKKVARKINRIEEKTPDAGKNDKPPVKKAAFLSPFKTAYRNDFMIRRRSGLSVCLSSRNAMQKGEPTTSV